MSDETLDPLQKLVRERAAELDLPFRKLAEGSHGLVSHTVLSRIAAGSYRGIRISGETAAGIALALKINEDDVLEAAEASLRPTTWTELADRFPTLPDDLQAEAVQMMRDLLDKSEKRRRRKNPFRESPR